MQGFRVVHNHVEGYPTLIMKLKGNDNQDTIIVFNNIQFTTNLEDYESESKDYGLTKPAIKKVMDLADDLKYEPVLSTKGLNIILNTYYIDSLKVFFDYLPKHYLKDAIEHQMSNYNFDLFGSHALDLVTQYTVGDKEYCDLDTFELVIVFKEMKRLMSKVEETDLLPLFIAMHNILLFNEKHRNNDDTPEVKYIRHEWETYLNNKRKDHLFWTRSLIGNEDHYGFNRRLMGLYIMDVINMYPEHKDKIVYSLKNCIKPFDLRDMGDEIVRTVEESK